MIELYFWPTPNGKKITIALEECGLPYRLREVNIVRGDQLKPEFLALNPNHRMPVIVDDQGPDGEPVTVFESGAILLYLAEKCGRFILPGGKGRFATIQWVVWQVANLGPKIGETNHFRRLGESAGDQTYASRRFDDETNRLYGVLNHALYRNPFIAGADYTIADMAVYPLVTNWQAHGQDLGAFEFVARWLDVIAARPAVTRGMAAGSSMSVALESFTPEMWAEYRAAMFNQRAIPIGDGSGKRDVR